MANTFWQHAYTEKSPYAKNWLKVGTLVQIGLIILGLSSYGTNDVEGSTWTNRDLAVVASLSLLLVAAYVMHIYDEKVGGSGVRDVYLKTDASHRVDDDVVSGVMARESIQVAITSGILGALVASVQLPKNLDELFKNPQLVFQSVISFALGISVITTLVGILCYDYSSRFRWPTGIRNLLIRKGHDLGRFGFYSLMWSLAAIPVVKSYYLCMCAVLVVFWVTWYYYFFPVERVKKFLPTHSQADFSNTDLQNRTLNGINLESVNLAGAQLQKAKLQRVRFAGAILKGAHLEGTDLTLSDVTQEQIDSALGDKETIIPESLVRPTAWAK